MNTALMDLEPLPEPQQEPENADFAMLGGLVPIEEPSHPADDSHDLELLPDDSRMWSMREKTYHDPAYVMTPEEFALFDQGRKANGDEMTRFLGAIPGAVSGLLDVSLGAAKEVGQRVVAALTQDPIGGVLQAASDASESVRKTGVGLAQLWSWASDKWSDLAARSRREEYVRGRLAAEGQLTGDGQRDKVTIAAAMKNLQGSDPAFAEFDREDAARSYDQYTRRKALDRAMMGVTRYRLGTSEIEESVDNPYVVVDPRSGEVVPPDENISTVVSMVTDPTNLVPMGVGAVTKLRILRRLASATGKPLEMVGKAAAGLEDLGQRAIGATSTKLTEKTGLSLGQQTAIGASAMAGGAWASQNGYPTIGAGIAFVGGILPTLRLGGVVLRNTASLAGAGHTITMEIGTGPMGAARAAAAKELAATGTIPARYAKYMASSEASGIDSTLKRIALSTENPEGLRRAARFADRMGATKLALAADDIVSGAAAGSVASLPMAGIFAPDAETAGQMVGSSAVVGAAGGLFGGVIGRSKQQIDTDIARMLTDVHAAGGDVNALLVMPPAELAKFAGLQGLLQGKVDFIPLRRRDYRANADISPHTGETAEGIFMEKGGTNRARIFVDMGEPAPFDGKVKITPTPDGRLVEILANDGRSDSTLVPHTDKLLVRDGQQVQANTPLVQGWNRRDLTAHEIGHAIFRSDMLDGSHRADIRNIIQQLYGEEGVQARAQEYATRLVDADIRAGVVEDAPLTYTPAEWADIEAGHKTPSDVLKSRIISPAQREELIKSRLAQLDEIGIERGDLSLDWARDEIAAETWSDVSANLDFSRLRRGKSQPWTPQIAESMLIATSRVLEMFGVSFDRTTGKMLDNPSALFRKNPLLRDPALRRRMIEYAKNYDQMLTDVEDIGRANSPGVPLARSASPEDLVKSQHVKLRDQGRGVLENDFMFIGSDGRPLLKTQAEITAKDRARAAQVSLLVGKKVLPQNAAGFGRRRTSDGRLVVGGAVLPGTFDFFNHWPQHIKHFARSLEAGRSDGISWYVDYNAIGSGSSGTYKVKNLGNVRSIQREVIPFGWTVSAANHLLAQVMDVSAFRAAAMRAINRGELGIFSNDMQQLQADLLIYMRNHQHGFPGEAQIGIAKRDVINGLLSSGTATARKANPNYFELNPRGAIRSIRLDRINDIRQSGRKGMWFDYDKVNNNRMPR